jgi:hypothetical protein
MIMTIVSLLPGFKGQDLSKKALDLAEWTALKDYIEQCKGILVSLPLIGAWEEGTLTIFEASRNKIARL